MGWFEVCRHSIEFCVLFYSFRFPCLSNASLGLQRMVAISLELSLTSVQSSSWICLPTSARRLEMRNGRLNGCLNIKLGFLSDSSMLLLSGRLCRRSTRLVWKPVWRISQQLGNGYKLSPGVDLEIFWGLLGMPFFRTTARKPYQNPI